MTAKDRPMPSREAMAPSAVGPGRDSAAAQTVVPVLQEELDIHTRRVETDAGVRVSKHTTQHEQVVDVPLTHEDVHVERIAVNRAIDAAPSVRHEGNTTIFPVVEEVLVVEKRLMLKEEIRVTRRREIVREPRRVTLRSEHAEVERLHGQAAEADAHPADRAAADDTQASLLEERRRQDEELRRGLGHSSR